MGIFGSCRKPPRSLNRAVSKTLRPETAVGTGRPPPQITRKQPVLDAKEGMRKFVTSLRPMVNRGRLLSLEFRGSKAYKGIEVLDWELGRNLC